MIARQNYLFQEVSYEMYLLKVFGIGWSYQGTTYWMGVAMSLKTAQLLIKTILKLDAF